MYICICVYLAEKQFIKVKHLQIQPYHQLRFDSVHMVYLSIPYLSKASKVCEVVSLCFNFCTHAVYMTSILKQLALACSAESYGIAQNKSSLHAPYQYQLYCIEASPIHV